MAPASIKWRLRGRAQSGPIRQKWPVPGGVADIIIQKTCDDWRCCRAYDSVGRDVNRLSGPEGTFLRILVRSEEERLTELENTMFGSMTLRHGDHEWQASRSHHISNAFKSPERPPLQPDVKRVSAGPSTQPHPQYQQPPLPSPLEHTRPPTTPVRGQNGQSSRSVQPSMSLEEVIDQARQYPTVATHVSSQVQHPMELGLPNGPSPARLANSLLQDPRLFDHRNPTGLVPSLGPEAFHQVHHYSAISPHSYSRYQQPMATSYVTGPPPTMHIITAQQILRQDDNRVPPSLSSQTEVSHSARAYPNMPPPNPYPQSQLPISTCWDTGPPPTMHNTSHLDFNLSDYRVRPDLVSHAESHDPARLFPARLPANTYTPSPQPISTGQYTGQPHTMPFDGVDHAHRLLNLLNHPANVHQGTSDMPPNSSLQNQLPTMPDHPTGLQPDTHQPSRAARPPGSRGLSYTSQRLDSTLKGIARETGTDHRSSSYRSTTCDTQHRPRPV